MSLSLCLTISRNHLKSFMKSSFFACLSFCSILGATVILCMDNIDLTEREYIRLNKADLAFSILLFFEVIVSLFAFGLKKYFSSNLNILDLLIAILHGISYICEASQGSDLSNPLNQYYIFVRWTKILRCFKLLHDFGIFGNMKIYVQTYY